VGVAHAAAVDDVGHLHAGTQLIGLDLDGEDGDGGGLHVVEDGGGHVNERARREVFENEGVEGAATLVELHSDGSGYWFGDAIGDDRDFLIGLNAQAGEDGGARTGREFCGEGLREQVGCGWGQACDDECSGGICFPDGFGLIDTG